MRGKLCVILNPRVKLYFTKEQVPKDLASIKLGAISKACKPQVTSTPIDVRRETTEILNKILPPKEWEEDGQIWTQRVNLDIFKYTNIFYITFM